MSLLVASASGSLLLHAFRLSSQGQYFIILATLSGLILCLTPSSSCHTAVPCVPLLTLVSVLACSACLRLLLGVTNRLPCVLQGATSTSTASSACLSLNASVSGLGPAFKLTLELCNTGSQPLLGTALVSPVTADMVLHMGPKVLHLCSLRKTSSCVCMSMNSLCPYTAVVKLMQCCNVALLLPGSLL